MSETMEVDATQVGQATTNNVPLNSIPENAAPTKIINDPFHGHIEMHPACMAIIDTPQFQRLRFIKQLGMCYFVYPGAAHNRFEHSIGVCHLAGQFARSLQKHQPDLNITDIDILCVEMAGLCHDLGQGPFSKMFEKRFIPEAALRKNERAWEIAEASLSMFDHMIAKNKLMEEGGVLRKSGLTDRDLTFIKEMFAGQLEPTSLSYKYKGRDVEKAFLYEIVNNKRNGIHVCKWDSFARDCRHLGLSNNFDYNRYIKFARVQPNGEVRQICTRDKEIWNLYNMYLAQFSLYKYAYQHRVNSALEFMVRDALLAADDEIKINGENRKYKVSECHKDMAAYAILTDTIIFKILDSENGPQGGDGGNNQNGAPEDTVGMRNAKALIRRVLSRKLYACIFESSPLKHIQLNEKDVLAEILDLMEEGDAKREVSETQNLYFVQHVHLNFLMENNVHPLTKLGLYTKAQPGVVIYTSQEEALRMQPHLNESRIRVYYKGPDGVEDENELTLAPGIVPAIRQACNKWYQKEKAKQDKSELQEMRKAVADADAAALIQGGPEMSR